MTPELSARLTKVIVDLSQKPGGPPVFHLLTATWARLIEKGVLDQKDFEVILEGMVASPSAPHRPDAYRPEPEAVTERLETDRRSEPLDSADEESMESFPASDPPSSIARAGTGAPDERRTRR